MKAGYLCCKDLVKVGDLNCWCKCMFSRDESLQQVCEKLPKDITTLAKYALFMHHIPMVSYLFYYYLSVLFPGVCQVNLLMSLSRFKKYNCEVYAHIDDQQSLCGFTEDSVQVCNLCFKNSQNVESYKFHNLTCPFLEDLYPDLAKDDEAMDVDQLLGMDTFDCWFTTFSFLQLALIDEMHREAAPRAIHPLFGVVQLPKLDSMDRSGMLSPKYMLVMFSCLHDN